MGNGPAYSMTGFIHSGFRSEERAGIGKSFFLRTDCFISYIIRNCFSASPDFFWTDGYIINVDKE